MSISKQTTIEKEKFDQLYKVLEKLITNTEKTDTNINKEAIHAVLTHINKFK